MPSYPGNAAVVLTFFNSCYHPASRFQMSRYRLTSAPGLSARPYFNRYTDDAVDLCDALSSFSSQGKATLDEISKVMGLPGKPEGMKGSEVDTYFRAGRLKEIADYCETDIVNTYRVWLRYELFRGRLGESAYAASERNCADYIKTHGNTKPHLNGLTGNR